MTHDRIGAIASSDAQALLDMLIGSWRGRARLWLEPDVLHCEDEVRGEIVPVHDGRWVTHRYATCIDGIQESGVALIGHDSRRWQIAWVDSWHTRSEIFLSHGETRHAALPIVVETSYDAGNGTSWRWRTEFEPVRDELYVRHFNINPAGEDAIAVEFAYTPTHGGG